MMVTLFNDILLFLHFGSASGMPPVRGALVIASFVSVSPASAPGGGRLSLRFKKHHPLSRLTPIWTGRVRSESGPGETASCDRAGCEGAACGRQGCSSFAFRGRLMPGVFCCCSSSFGDFGCSC